ncbi:RDD family protein [Hymenobacter properus]|uniref:RDD family protein n=1 Tax=Hymenobacter properus TaxID=2791026 RepID=A0A931BL18_9BACT|nr:RDD family protein [Hymenobacter properus]MBF9142203.1 RDD family protein [Hymenobacter properus]MBR7721010.1 RDD family protein [Microvirga sp. SRT04]
MATVRVHTAQNVSLEYEVASLGDRIVAAILDNLILGAWLLACGMMMAAMEMKGSTSTVFLGVLGGVPFVFYHLICEVFFNGQSLGKRARDIRVMRLDGTAPSVGDYLLRWLLRIIDTGIMGGLVAIITIAANGRGQRLGDLAAGTTVVKVRPQATSPLAPGLSPIAGYQPVFPQAALLADHDVALIRQLAQQASARGNYEVLNEIANKVKEITGIRTDLPDGPFLQTVLRDHAHLAATA